MKSPFTRLALLVAATAVSVPTPDTHAGVVDGRYDLQYYLDFCRNKGMFATGATNIEVFFKDGTSIANNTIPLMPNMDSYGRVVNSVVTNPVTGISSITSGGGINLVSAQFVYGAGHVYGKVGDKDIAFLSENGSPDHVYDSANGIIFGSDSAIQRLSKLVTEVAYTPLASAEFMQSLTTNGTWVYRIGNGGAWSGGTAVSTGENALGGVVNLSGITYNSSTGEWKLEGYARTDSTTSDSSTPLDIGTYSGDSGSPYFAWDETTQQFVFVGAHFGGDGNTKFPNWYISYYNPTKATAIFNSYMVAVSGFSGTETIVWSASDASTGKGTLTQGSVSVEYTGLGSDNAIADTKGLTFSSVDSANTQNLQLQGNVNMGAGALTFESGKWKLSEADSAYTLASAGFEIKKGAELTLELTGTSSEEIRKVGEGTLTIAGSGNNESKLVVGGGTTVYNVVRDENGNITGCTLGNAGETRLDRTDGYAASSVRLEGGVAIVVLMQDGQFKTNTTAGDTFSFGNDGGLLNLNGHDLEWGVINQDGSGTGARIGNFTPSGENKPENATFTYTGTGTFAGSFMDEGADGAQLAVVYNNAAEGSTWNLTGNSSNYGDFTVEAGTMKLEGTKTPHVNFSDANDWTYASIETSKITVNSGATFQLSHHALLSGNVEVEAGGNFVMNQTVNAASESVSGSRRQNMAELGITSLKGNVTLNGTASMTVNTTSPVATTMQGNISGETGSVFTKTGSGLFVVDGQVAVGTGTVEAGGVVVKNKDGFTGTWTIQEAGYLGVEGMNGDAMLSHISAESTGVLALGADQTTAITNLGNYTNLYIGALGTLEKAVEYGVAGTTDTLSANSENKWLLGGGGGTLNVNFKLSGANSLIIGNDASGGTVHLTNTGNDFSGDIIIKGTGNILTYENGALGNARVALSYGNTLALNDVEQLSILKDGAQGILAITQSQDLDLSGKATALGATGDLTYTGTLTAGDKYRFGGSGNLTLDTALSGASEMELDGQGNTGSSVTFARENAFTGTITAGGGLYLDEVNSAGDIAIHVGHENALKSVSSVELQKGATLYTDGNSLVVNNLSAQSGSSIQNNGETASLLQLSVGENTETTIADGVLSNSMNSANLALVKTGAGTLNMGANTSWSGGLTVMEGTVKGSIASGGIGASGASIYVNEGATLNLTASAVGYSNLSSTVLPQVLTGSGTVNISNGTEMFLSTQSAGFEGKIVVGGNTRLYVANGAQTTTSGTKYYTSQAFDKATIVVEAGSQVRLTSSVHSMSGSAVSSYADYVIAGSTYDGSASGLVQSQHDGALVIDHQATVYGNVTLAENATISSWSYNPTESQQYASGWSYRCTVSPSDQYANRYGIINKLGGTIRGKILGEGKTLTFGGNEGMTITADSANTFGDLIIANGNGNNYADSFALRLNNGAAKSQTSTALGTGSVTLNSGLILRLAGTGSADNSNIVYTYENAISAGDNATLQSYNITNRLAGTIAMSGSTLNLATANGGVLELAGGISGNGTLNVGANSKIVLGSASSTMALARSGSATFSGTVVTESGADITLMSPAVVSETTTFSGTDSLTLRLAGTEDYTLGGITLTGSSVTNDDGTTGTTATTLTLNFDFSNIPTASDDATWTTLNSAISANTVQISLDLNMFNDINSGEYSLLNGNLSVTDYTLADDLNGRLSLKTDTANKLILVVGGDNRLYWRTNGTSHNWNTTDANWYLEGNSALTTFSANNNVVFDASGVAEGNSADSRETITLSADQTVGTLAAKDENAFYEVTGTAALTGTNLAVGLGGDLKLSTTSANFTNGVRIDNATLEVSGTALTADVNATNGGSFSLSDSASLTGTLSLSDSSATINDSTVNGNISTFGTGSLSMTNAVLGSNSVTFENGTSLALTGATLSGDLNWQKDNDAITSVSLAVVAGSVSSNAALQATSVDIASGSTLTITGSRTSSIDTVTGSGALKMADGNTATLNLGNASLTSLNLLGGTTNISGTVTLGSDARLSLGKATLNLNDGANVTTTHFRSGDQGSNHPSIINVNAGATLNITGSTNIDNTGSSFLLAHWGSSASSFVLNGGTVNATNTSMLMSWDSGASFSALSGEANLKGIRFSSARGNADTFSLGSATEGSARINIGADGITGIGTNDTVNLGEGTIGASANYSINGNAVNLIGTKNGTIFDTGSHTVTVNAALNGTGILAKNGTGTLTVAGNGSGFTGQINVAEGTLALGGSATFGALSGLTVADGATLDLSDIDFSERTALSLAENAVASIGNGAIFAFGALESDTQYTIFDLSSGATLDGWNSNNLGVANFSINGESMLDMGRVYVSLNETTGSFIYYKETYDLVWNGGETGGTWNRAEDNSVWLQSIDGSTSETATYFANYDNVAFNGNANVTIAEDVKVGAMTIADGASVSLTETGTLTAESISVGNGATLTFATEKAGYSTANISGAGTVVLDLTNDHNNQLKLGAEFTGETHLSNGYFTITGAQVGSKLTLGTGTEYQTTDTAGTTVTADIVLEGTTRVHANSGKAVIYSKSVTGNTYLSKGSSSHTFNGTVDLTAFNTEGVATVNFNAVTDIDTLTVDAVNASNVGVTVNANRTTTIGTFAISNNTKANFNGETTITTATISGGTVNFTGATTLHALNATDGTVVASGHLTKIGTGALAISGTAILNSVDLQEGSLEFTNGENTSKSVGTLTLGNSVVFSTQQNVSPSEATVVNALNLSGATATVRIGNAEAGTDSKWGNSHQGYLQFKELGLSGVESGTLNLVANHNSSLRTIFEFGDSSASSASAGTFKGEINLAVNNSGNRSASLVLSDATIAQNAHINLATNAGSSGVLSLGVNADRVTIAGLSSALGTSKSKVYSGKIGVESSAGYADSSTENRASRTLEINVADGASYSYNGEILANLMLVKTGTGTQTLAGANTSFNGRISVEAGTLIAGHANALGTGAISVASGAVLQANAEITLSAASQALTLVVGEEQIVPAVATYAALRSADETGTALITSGEGSNGKISVSDDAIVYVDVSALTGTQSVLSGDTISLQLATESALDFNDANAKVGWWDESGTSWTDWSLASNYTYDSASGLLTITIPEPSAFGLLAGLSALALCVSRRRRRK